MMSRQQLERRILIPFLAVVAIVMSGLRTLEWFLFTRMVEPQRARVAHRVDWTAVESNLQAAANHPFFASRRPDVDASESIRSVLFARGATEDDVRSLIDRIGAAWGATPARLPLDPAAAERIGTLESARTAGAKAGAAAEVEHLAWFAFSRETLAGARLGGNLLELRTQMDPTEGWRLEDAHRIVHLFGASAALSSIIMPNAVRRRFLEAADARFPLAACVARNAGAEAYVVKPLAEYRFADYFGMLEGLKPDHTCRLGQLGAARAASAHDVWTAFEEGYRQRSGLVWISGRLPLVRSIVGLFLASRVSTPVPAGYLASDGQS